MRARRSFGWLLRRRREGGTAARLAALEQELKRVRREQRRHLELLLRSQRALDALVRHAYVDPEALPYPQRLTAQRFGVLSQNTEDGILLAILRAAGVRTGRFVEIGCGGNGGNSGFLASELGWSGLMIDASEQALAEAALRFNPERVSTLLARVDRDNVNDLLRRHGVEGGVDVLSIDIDGNDFWVWEALDAVSPRVVVVEFNALFGPSRAVVVPYDPAATYKGGSYYGASLGALARLAARKGYRLVAVDPRGVNAFFVRDGEAEAIPAAEPAAAYAPLTAPAHLYGEIGAKAESLAARESELDALVRDRGLPLVEID